MMKGMRVEVCNLRDKGHMERDEVDLSEAMYIVVILANGDAFRIKPDSTSGLSISSVHGRLGIIPEATNMVILENGHRLPQRSENE